jgi:uncharacterized membrane protein AbrB (regulator of aidB expression)
MLKKNLPTVLIILITLILIVVIYWYFDKKIGQIEMEHMAD